MFHRTPVTSTRAFCPAGRLVEPLEGRILFVAGDLDPGFGVGGIAIADFGMPGVVGIDVAASGNRVYAAGIVAAEDGQQGRVALAAFDRAGRPDASFAGDGTIVTDLTLPFGRGEMLVQPDGKIVVLNGTAALGQRNYAVARFNPDGTVDRSFGGGDGKVELTIGTAMTLGPGGKLVISGGASFAVDRLNPDGSFDTTFDGDGQLVLDFGGNNDSGQVGAVDVAVMNDGRILLVGAQQGDDPDNGFHGWYAAAARLNPDGSYDTTFGDNGRQLSRFGYMDNGYSAAATGPHGEVLVGIMQGEIKARPEVVTGSATIPAGTFFTPLGYDLPTINRMHIQGDGKVVVSGTVSRSFYDDGSPETFLARYMPDGSLDPTFANGHAARPTSDKTALASDGDIVALAGTGEGLPLSSITGVAVARYLGSDADNRTTVIPAEAPRSLNGADVSKAHPGYTGSGYVDFIRDSGATAAYSFYANQTGNYELRIRYANGSHRARIMSVGFFERGGGAKIAFLPTGSWSRWREARVTLPMTVHTQLAEQYVIELTTTGRNGPNIDKITVIRPDVPATLQAEDATLVGAAALAQHPGYEGRGYADFIDPNSYVEWEFNSSVAQTMSLTARYANGSTSARVLGLSVNGSNAGGFAFRPTGSWSTWRTETTEVQLAAGLNRIRLPTGADGAGPNIDWLRVG